jgi:hypothetical protein
LVPWCLGVVCVHHGGQPFLAAHKLSPPFGSYNTFSRKFHLESMAISSLVFLGIRELKHYILWKPKKWYRYYLFIKKKHLTGSKNNVPLDKCTFDGNYVFTILLLKKKPHGVILRVKLYFLNHLDILKLIRGWKAYFAFYLHRMTLMSLKMRNYKAIIEVVFFFFCNFIYIIV